MQSSWVTYYNSKDKFTWRIRYFYRFCLQTGGLSLAVEGPSKAEISCHDHKDGTVSVSYLPTAPGEYKIAVKFGDKHIKGSPFVAKVTGMCLCMCECVVYLFVGFTSWGLEQYKKGIQIVYHNVWV